MATTSHRVPSATPAPLASTMNGTTSHAHDDHSLPNGHHIPTQEPRPAPTPTAAMASNAANKKAKGKKALDSSEASKLVAARISQLEVDTAAEREQEAEIGTSNCFFRDHEAIAVLYKRWAMYGTAFAPKVPSACFSKGSIARYYLELCSSLFPRWYIERPPALIHLREKERECIAQGQ